MGIGLALMEDTDFDERTARIMNPGDRQCGLRRDRTPRARPSDHLDKVL
jgi:hypothetical protein